MLSKSGNGILSITTANVRYNLNSFGRLFGLGEGKG